MSFRRFSILVSMAIAGSAMADPLTFASTSFANNGTTRTNWLNAMSISSPDITADFESIPNGNISGIANIYPGLTITSSDGSALVTNSTGLLGTSNPIGLNAVALLEDRTITINFATSVDYFSLVSIDASNVAVTTTYVGGSTTLHNFGSSATTGNTGVFFGLYRNDRPQITSVTLLGIGGDGEWGIDNVEFGAVPEPATALAISLGLGALARRRNKK